MIKISNLITHNDASEAWGLFFQSSATFQMTPLEELHNNIMFYLSMTLFAVSWIMLNTILNYRNLKLSNKYINYSRLQLFRISLVKFIWDITKGLLLTFIALSILLWYTHPFLELCYLIVIKGMGFTKAGDLIFTGQFSMFDSILYGENFGLVMDNNGLCWDKLLMNINELLNPTPVRSAVPEIIDPIGAPSSDNPLVLHYSHGKRDQRGILMNISERASDIGFFYITNIRGSQCDVNYLEPLPSFTEVEKMGLLIELTECFPQGNYSCWGLATHPTHLDPYRMHAYLYNVLANECNNNPDWMYKSDQTKPTFIDPYYDRTLSADTYRSWARAIADSVEASKSQDSRRPVILDENSAKFLATFRNARADISPTQFQTSKILQALREL